MTAEKKCYRCGNFKPRHEFRKDKTRKDGLQNRCFSCQKILQSDHFQRNKHKVKERVDIWRAKNPEKWLAHRIVERSVLNGSLKKASSCSVCGDKRHVEAHHEDYSEPLDVTWLCRKHHIARHKQIDAETAE